MYEIGGNMNCPKCNVANARAASFCMGCGSKLESLAHRSTSTSKKISTVSDVTINIVEKKQPKKLGCFGLVFVVILVSMIFSAVTGNTKNEPSAPVSEPTRTQETSAYCGVLMKYLNEAVEYMGNAGTEYSISDVTSVLKDRGTALATGFDLTMAGSEARLVTIRDAGKQLLQIRVNLLDGGDITPAAEAFKRDYEFISETCK
jgi:hypothetical protein